MIMQPTNNPKALFKTGELVFAAGVNELVARDKEFAKQVTNSLARHTSGDWGDMSNEDKKENELSIGKHLRIFSAYNCVKKIWIITEADRSVTTVLFPDEY